MQTSAKLTDLVTIPAGASWIGSDDFYPEERPSTKVTVAAFQLERSPVTNEQFARFVADTGWVTTAERPIPDDIVGIPPELREPGSLVFTPTDGPVDFARWELWWRWVPGANWRRPFGPSSGLDHLQQHPVVHVSKEDAEAYAQWAGRRLPTETEWEHAVSFASHPYAWGAEFSPGGDLMANTFQGHFPYHNTGAKGWFGTSPVGTFPATRHGLFDMIGNVWEWTTSAFSASHRPAPSCCGTSSDAASGQSLFVVKGGSHLCNPAYCARYRPAARQPQSADSATTHLGFRCAV